MSKCIEKPTNRREPISFSTVIDYEYPVCGHVRTSKNGCESHVYKKHNDWAHEDSKKKFMG